jgi:hypothetical protein
MTENNNRRSAVWSESNAYSFDEKQGLSGELFKRSGSNTDTSLFTRGFQQLVCSKMIPIY